MILVQFTSSDGGPIWINPEVVGVVSQGPDGAARIFLVPPPAQENQEWVPISVKERVEDVVRILMLHEAFRGTPE